MCSESLRQLMQRKIFFCWGISGWKIHYCSTFHICHCVVDCGVGKSQFPVMWAMKCDFSTGKLITNRFVVERKSIQETPPNVSRTHLEINFPKGLREKRVLRSSIILWYSNIQMLENGHVLLISFVVCKEWFRKLGIQLMNSSFSKVTRNFKLYRWRLGCRLGARYSKCFEKGINVKSLTARI